jgi:hypothetical protein
MCPPLPAKSLQSPGFKPRYTRCNFPLYRHSKDDSGVRWVQSPATGTTDHWPQCISDPPIRLQVVKMPKGTNFDLRKTSRTCCSRSHLSTAGWPVLFGEKIGASSIFNLALKTQRKRPWCRKNIGCWCKFKANSVLIHWGSRIWQMPAEFISDWV